MSNKLSKQPVNEITAVHKVFKFLKSAVDLVICIYMLLIIVVMPFYNQEGHSHIGTDKCLFFKTVSVDTAWVLLPLLGLCLLLYCFLVIREGKAGEAMRRLFVSLSVTDLCALGFGVVVVISYLCSSYKEEALWGTRGWYMGMMSQLFLVSIYFLVSRLWKRRSWIPFLFLPVSGVVFLLGYLNRFGIYPIKMAAANPSFISTIGNINWYCGYLVTVFFGGAAVLWMKKPGKRLWDVLLYAYVGLGFASLTTQGSSSGILTMLVLLLALFLLSVRDGGRMRRFFELLLLLAGVCLVTCVIRVLFPGRITYLEGSTDLFTLSPLPALIGAVALGLWLWIVKSKEYPAGAFRLLGRIAAIGTACCALVFVGLLILNTCWPGSIGPLSDIAFLRFTPDWGSNRGATWSAGILCFAEQGLLKKLVGVGPDCMASYIYKNGGDGVLSLVRESFGNDRLTNAHNEWLTMLVNVGLLGMVSYAGMIVSAVVRFLKARGRCLIAGAAGLCILAYSVNNVVSFQQPMNAAAMFVILGIGEAFLRQPAGEGAGK